MTTAHRPTWHPALAGEGQGGNKLLPSAKQSSKDLPGYKVLKTRHDVQQRVDHKRSLDDREREYKHKLAKHSALEHTVRSAETAALENDLNPFPEDADDDGPQLAGNASDDEDDEEAELRRELEIIKRERLEDEKKKALATTADQADAEREKVLRGNPLLLSNSEVAIGMGRRWDDDVVFRNQCKGRAKQKKTFINDAVRSDFHKKFLTKYIV